jgi:aerobic-type carbon monoxide dehydrogenase small subunit (CoxS/CutS family)
VNGQEHTVDVDPATPLLLVLRNELGLTGAKLGCGLEQCGACAVLVDGQSRLSCSTAVEAFVERDIVTVEGIAATPRYGPLIAAMERAGAGQCGYCIPGIVVALAGALDDDRAADETVLRAALQPHLCRCGAHPRVLRAVRELVDGSP